MKLNYDNKKFRPIQTGPTGQTTSDTVFHYHQSGSVVSATYAGGQIIQGHLLGIVNDQGHIECMH